MVVQYTQDDIIKELQRVDSLVSGKLTQRKFKMLGEINHKTPAIRFGSWNKAKEAAGLETIPPGGDRQLTKEVYNSIKESVSCFNCGESREAALQFHHKDKNTKSYNVGRMASTQYALDTILKEMEKCIPICANCHFCLHDDDGSVTLPEEKFNPREYTDLL